MGRINPLIAVGIPSWGKLAPTWARAYKSLGGPLGSTTIEQWVIGEPIAKARNEIMAWAIQNGAEFLYFHGDDVLAPSNIISSMLTRMRNHPDIDLLTGVYWTREWPTAPYIWRGMQRGPFLDWKMGEVVQVDFAGCDALMIRLSDRVKALGPDWFSTDWVWEPGQDAPMGLATEDFYFYTRARVAGLKLWCDTGLQCIHEDRNSGMQFGLTAEMPQAGGLVPDMPATVEGAPVRIADIGCGGESPYFGEPGAVSITRIDLDESKHPDIRADVRDIPVDDQTFDVVHSRHVLEHFGRAETTTVLREWCRVLRIGGELRLNLPNALSAMEWLVKMEHGETEVNPYPSWQLYGRQDDERDYHKNWFTPRRLKLLLEMPVFGLSDVVVEEIHEGQNLQATARKAVHTPPFALTPAWDAIARREGILVPGLAVGDAGPIEPLPERAFTTLDAAKRINEAMQATPDALIASPDSGSSSLPEVPSSTGRRRQRTPIVAAGVPGALMEDTSHG